MKSSEADQRSRWMVDFTRRVLAAIPGHLVRGVEARHLYDSRYSPADAADRYIRAQRVASSGKRLT